MYLERLRLAGTEPLAIDRVWLPHRLAAPLLDVDFTETALYIEYARHCGVVMTGGEESIHVAMPTDAQQALLGITPEVALFAIERVGSSNGELVELRHTSVRGDRVSVTAEVAPHSRRSPAKRPHLALITPARDTISWKDPL